MKELKMIRRKSSIPLDVPFLLSLSDKTLPLIEKNKDALEKDTHQWLHDRNTYRSLNAIAFLEYRKEKFLKEQQTYSWLSWNAADDYVKKELTAEGTISSIK